MKKKLFLITCLCGLTQALAQPIPALQKITSSDLWGNDQFGRAVAIHGQYAAVGTINEGEDANGENTLWEAGAVYVFEKDSETTSWVEVQKIVPSDRAKDDRFGYSVAIEGDYLVVGAIGQDLDENGGDTLVDPGAAYVFQRNAAGVWQQMQKLVAFENRFQGMAFGTSVAIEGHTLLVGSPNEGFGANPSAGFASGAVYIYDLDQQGNWDAFQKIKAADFGYTSRFGDAVSLSGNHLLIGARGERKDVNGQNTTVAAGAAYFFARNSSDGSWSQTQKVVNAKRQRSDVFGDAVAISGEYAVVGEPGQDDDLLGDSSMASSGAAYLYHRQADGTWTLIDSLNSPHRHLQAYFGEAVAIDGDRLFIGCRGDNFDELGDSLETMAGATYMYEKDGDGQWNLTQKLVAPKRISGAQMGNVVCAKNGELIIGSYLENPTGWSASHSGAAFIAGPATMTALGNQRFGPELSLYPNPTQGDVALTFGEFFQEITVSVHNMMGQLLYMDRYVQGKQISVPIKGPAGMYVVSATATSGHAGSWKVWKK
ncbi:MAG: T9SS type A sorting domain-containing protein [Bacteroidota bacterium]